LTDIAAARPPTT